MLYNGMVPGTCPAGPAYSIHHQVIVTPSACPSLIELHQQRSHKPRSLPPTPRIPVVWLEICLTTAERREEAVLVELVF